MVAEAHRLGLLSVRGNHDDEALAAWEAYTYHGHEPPEHRAWVKQLPEASARWLHGLPWSLRVPSHGLTIVHAGLVPEVRAVPRAARTVQCFQMHGVKRFMSLQGLLDSQWFRSTQGGR